MKKFRYLFICLFSFILFSVSVSAASYDVSITSTTLTVSNSVTLTIKGNNIAGKFTISSSNTGVASLSNTSIWVDSNSQSITVKANKAGTAVLTITPTDVTGYDGSEITGRKTITITVKEKSTSSSGTSGSSGGSSKNTTTKKSTNNYLTSISIDGVTLSPEFDKETLEYTASIPAGSEKIKVNAQLDDSSASVSGTGEIKVSEGVNNISIVVTAENGSKRTYKISATVLEETPIKVTIDSLEYTVVRKRADAPELSEYNTEKEIEIDGNKIEGYYNETLKYTLVALKDNSGNVEFYIYDNGKYTIYKEYTFNGKVLQILDKEVSSNYKKTSFVYDNDKIVGYQEVKLNILKNTYALDNNDISGNQFYLFYAMNVETGKEQLYQYDALEKTVQRYNTQILDMYKDRSDKYYMCLLGSILFLGIVIIVFSLLYFKKPKKKKMKLVKETVEEDIPIVKNKKSIKNEVIK